jgi:hypothetical protein
MSASENPDSSVSSTWITPSIRLSRFELVRILTGQVVCSPPTRRTQLRWSISESPAPKTHSHRRTGNDVAAIQFASEVLGCSRTALSR